MADVDIFGKTTCDFRRGLEAKRRGLVTTNISK
jgi:hypothetical protein